jgi:hypothetical protein
MVWLVRKEIKEGPAPFARGEGIVEMMYVA